MRTILTLTTILLLTSFSSVDSADQENRLPIKGVGQLGEPISWIAIPNSPDRFYMGQRSGDGRLILTPNEAFFPKLGLTASGRGCVEDVENLNGGKSFATINKWDAGDTAEWGLFFETTGKVTIRVWMSATNEQSKFTLRVGEKSVPIETKISGDRPAFVGMATVMIQQPGQQTLKLTCDDASPGCNLHWIEISGAAATNAAVLRKRWRPAAAHTKFSSSTAKENIRLWVMEMDAVPGDLGFYSPITTPFGYYGPTWKADGMVNAGFNFSLWSFARGKPEPPVQQLSHLLGIGNRRATFGGFDHEGTGVKVRDWEPLAGRQGQRQVLALRVEPGEQYDTYYSYFYEADTKRWRLFAIGNKYNKEQPLKSLWVGSFVEVPGPPHVQRTGPYERTMRYRGWVMDTAGEWHPLDQMQNGNVNRQTGLTHTDRGLTKDGWFYLQTGGWTFRKGSPAAHVTLPDAQQVKRPDYLTDQDITFLKSVPSAITATIEKRTANRIQGTFQIRNLGADAEATIFWGTAEGLTFADRWQNHKPLEDLHEGENTFSIDTTESEQPVFVRLLLRNNEGQFWSPQTLTAGRSQE